LKPVWKWLPRKKTTLAPCFRSISKRQNDA